MASLAAQLDPLWKVRDAIRSGTLQRNALADTSQQLKEEALSQMAKVIGADMAMRNYPRGGRAKPRKAGFGYTLHSNNTATLNFRPGGMWRIVEDGTSQHTVGGQGRVTNRGRRIGTRNESIVYKIGGEYRSGIRHVKGAKPQGSPGARTMKQLPPEWQKAFAKQYARFF